MTAMPIALEAIPTTMKGILYCAKKIAAPERLNKGSTSVTWCAQQAIMAAVEAPSLVAVIAQGLTMAGTGLLSYLRACTSAASTWRFLVRALRIVR